MSRVRVIIPTFNRAALISKAVASALTQQDVDLEVVVVDDGSTDDTTAVLGSLSRRNPRVRCLSQPNRGVAAARNAGLCADGPFEFVAFLDADDEWIDSRHLAKALDVLHTSPRIGLTFAQIETSDHVGHWDSAALARRAARFDWCQANASMTPQQGVYVLDPAVAFLGILRGKVSPHTSTVVLRSRLDDVKIRFDGRLAVFEDIDLFARVARRYHLAYEARQPTKVHYYGDNLTSQQSLNSPRTLEKWCSLTEYAANIQRICETQEERREARRLRGGYAYMVGQCLVEQGRNRAALVAYWSSMRSTPTWLTLRGAVRAALNAAIRPRAPVQQ
jgi:glycosyltransferase involved in cell wall biosynthesis